MHSSGTLGFLVTFVLVAACGSDTEPDQPESSSSAGGATQGASAGGRAAETSGAQGASSPTSGSAAPALGESSNCCVQHGSVGCDNEAVAECVCSQDSFCCSKGWDSACAKHVEGLDCGICAVELVLSGDDASGGASPDGGGDGEEPAPTPPSSLWSSCCAAGTGSGCGDTAIEDCVCFVDPYCCDTKWDSYCASEVGKLGCGSCSTYDTGAGGAGQGHEDEGGAAGSGGGGG